MEISIIIPTFNGKELLKKNLPAVVAAVGRNEIIVVDDFSSDGTAGWIKENYPQIEVIRNEKNLRFGESCNLGVKGARGDIVVLLNNDVAPQAGFLKPIMNDFGDKEVFAVGCKELNLEEGKQVVGGRGVSKFERGFVVHWRPKDQNNNKSATWVSGGSAAFSRDVWLKLGGFDGLFYPAYEEDRDLCWQALKAGYKVFFEPKSIVNHRHETTNRLEFGERRIALYSMKNQFLFVWKNISSFKLLTWHVLWLLYHLLVTSIKTKGVFQLAFFMALMQLPEAIASRIKATKNWKIKDEEILDQLQV